LNDTHLKFNETIPLVQYRLKEKEKNEKSLLGEQSDDTEVPTPVIEEDATKLYPFLVPAIDLNLIYDNQIYDLRFDYASQSLRGHFTVM